jgi:uncharacterized membrane protein YeaQ/YmgE (transglycosylase-associated protein family)
MSIIGTIVVGGIAGALGKLIMPGKDPGGIFITIGLGIAGAFIMNFIGKAVGWYGEGDNAGLIAAVIGSVILLAGYRMFKGKQDGAGPVA